MSGVAEFVAELFRAANELEKLTEFEKRRLLERAVTIIRDMRDETGIAGRSLYADPIDQRSDETVKAALLDAAGIIRTLKIILDD
ncbi:hypothetical protein B0E45_01210 [Sinorhizobium sp. A49]|uniref:hypothetical protein n=1 Tax=Sinorhizobium sp. A49 TaxID=1945861 RepID=UPI0009864897|nr:hypothetical protein [Sinorhizobium sp. A49]OOG75576.1 hypothetical protein B0E45_01210 [Sinorhizobium sp. A49]